jgi:hypothetical protein
MGRESSTLPEAVKSVNFWELHVPLFNKWEGQLQKDQVRRPAE